MNKVVAYGFVSLHYLVSAFTGALGLGFVTLAVYMAWSDISAAGEIKAKFLMMPTMNLLISSVLFFYCIRLFRKAQGIRRAIASDTFKLSVVRITRYDLLAIAGFFLFVSVVGYFLL